MSAALAFVRLFWKPLAAVAAALIVLWALHHYGATRFADGYRQAASEDAKAVDQQLIKNAEKEKADAERIADAYRDRDESLAQLAAVRALPAPKLLCRRASSRTDSLPSSAAVSGAQAPSGGLLPEQDAGDSGGTFDPGPAAIELAFEAARVVADCRMLNQSVNGVPTSP